MRCLPVESRSPLREGRIKDRFQHLKQRLLDQAIHTVGMPSVLTPPFGLGMSTGAPPAGDTRPPEPGLYVGQCCFTWSSNSSTVIPSTPAAPLF